MREKIKSLKEKANQVRTQILEMIVSAGKGHIGGSLSCADILVTLYYGGSLRFSRAAKSSVNRDRFILSKGHSAATLYVILADLGYFGDRELKNYLKEGCILRGHPDRKIPGIEVDAGSLGHGLGIGAGIALSAKMDRKDSDVFALLGDGECYEGSVWEAAMFAAHHRLGNLCAIVDSNGLCSTDYIKNCVDLEPLNEKWASFGWDVRIVDGHSFEELLSVFNYFRSRKSDKPFLIIAKTLKGKGISFMEGKPGWHHTVPKGEQIEIARKELKNEDF